MRREGEEFERSPAKPWTRKLIFRRNVRNHLPPHSCAAVCDCSTYVCISYFCSTGGSGTRTQGEASNVSGSRPSELCPSAMWRNFL